MSLSAVDCVQPALQHTRQQLFNPFRWGQWSRLALVGILAAEIHAGGCNFGNIGGKWPHIPHKSGNWSLPSSSLPSGLPHFNPGQISDHIGQFLGLIVLAVFAIIVLSFVFLFISSVFRFILFESVLRRQCSIGEGWHKWRRAGGRFFLWQIVFQISAMLFLAVLIGIPVALALASGWSSNLRDHIGRLILGAIFFFGLLFVFVLCAAAVQVIARDFLVPVMALEDLDFADGWSRVLAMIRPEKGRFVGYLLLKLVLAIAAGILFSIIAIIPVLVIIIPAVVAVVAGHAAGLGWNVNTISLAIIFGTLLLLLLIYLVALVSVPATVFFPAYAMYFLASRYPQLDVLLNPLPPVTAIPEPPVVPESPPPFEPQPLPPSPEPIG